MSVQEDIKDLITASADSVSKAERLSRLVSRYPDLKKYVGRWKKIAYYSRSVNGLVDQVDVRHNCGCCSDSPLEAWPYVETEDGRVYSDPPMFNVGHRTYDYDDEEKPGWDDSMRSHGIRELILDKIRPLFRKNDDGDE
jgi:hypothetical protein